MQTCYSKTVYIKLQYCDEIFTVRKYVYVTPENPFNPEQITLEAQEYVIFHHKQRQMQIENKIRCEKEKLMEMKRNQAIDENFIQLAERRNKQHMIHGIKILAICKSIPQPIEHMIIKNYESIMTPSEQLAKIYFDIPTWFHYHMYEFYTLAEIQKFAEIIDGYENCDKLKEHENKKYRKFRRTFNYLRRIKQRSD